MQNASAKILALVPAYNEGARVRGVVEGARRHLPVLVVDDGSTDDTTAHAEGAGAELLRRPKNGGKGMALRDGFRHALTGGYDAVLTLDADGQHDPAEIPAFLQRFAESGADLIIGSRDFHHMPPVRRFANSLGRHLFSWAIGQPVADNQSGYRFVHRRLMQSMLESDEHGFEFEVEMIVVCVRNGYKLDWVPIRTIYAGEKSHIRRGHHVKHFFRVVWQTRRAMQGARKPG
ncbi:MAG TPA: glycosyltransferase family 2 protein [Candidatus Krumholzibacteria bacterium]|nr:glycosyltransferase family 2 protein [Candidatus Krumholzibacteria bacterium]